MTFYNYCYLLLLPSSLLITFFTDFWAKIKKDAKLLEFSIFPIRGPQSPFKLDSFATLMICHKVVYRNACIHKRRFLLLLQGTKPQQQRR